ncbi:MAG: endonuclease domain-containing protein [Devosia sp.]
MSIERARSLRKRMSPPEARMWNVLRREPFADYHFRRQVPLGRYYADFASHRAKLVIEIDGGSHFSGGALQYDAARDAFLAAAGYAVLRLTTADVMNNLDGAAEAILAHLTPTRLGCAEPPSPQGGGRGENRSADEVSR